MAVIKQLSPAPVFYKEIQMMTSDGVHQEVQKLVEDRLLDDHNSYVCLDLAAGQGALSQRIFDAGFTNITAWELESDKFLPKDIAVQKIDLNKDFPAEARGKYNLVTAVEIIEHLENPFHFMRQIEQVLSANGIAIISTPNIESSFSRIQFLIDGRFRWFSDGAYKDWGHINPLTSWEMKCITERAGLKIIATSTNVANNGNSIMVDPGSKNIAKGIVAWLLQPFMKGSYGGDIRLWVIARADESN